MSSLVCARQCASECMGVFKEFGIVLEDGHEIPSFPDIINEGGFVPNKSENGASNLALSSLDRFDSAVVERLTAPDAKVFMSWSFPCTAWALKRANRLRFRCFDLHTVEPSVLIICLTPKTSDVVRRGVASALTALPVFDEGLVHTPTGEECRIGLAEVRWRHGLRDIHALSSISEGVKKPPIREGFRLSELRPERGVGVIRLRVISQPSLQVGNTRDKHNRPLSSLPVNHYLETMLVVVDVTNSQLLEFVATGAGVKRNSNERSVTRIPRPVFDHWQNVTFPVEHVRWIGDGIVAIAGSRWNPFDTRWFAFFGGYTLAEHSDGDSEIFLRIFVVVRSFDPTYNLLGSISILERASESTDVLSNDCTVTEKLEVAIIAVFRVEKFESIAEFEQPILVILTDLIGQSNPVAHILDARWSIGHLIVVPSISEIMNLRLKSPTEHSNRIAFLRFFRLFTMK